MSVGPGVRLRAANPAPRVEPRGAGAESAVGPPDGGAVWGGGLGGSTPGAPASMMPPPLSAVFLERK